MRDVIVVAVILGLFAVNLWWSLRWWNQYRDPRAMRGVLAGIGLFCGAIALAIATWSLQTDGPERVIELVRLLVWFGQGVLLVDGVALLYFAFRERRT